MKQGPRSPIPPFRLLLLLSSVLWYLGAFFNPRQDIWLPAQVAIVCVNHPTSGDSGRRGDCQILHLKQERNLKEGKQCKATIGD